MLEWGITSQIVIIFSLVWAHKLSYLHQFMLKFQYQVRKVSKHRCICVLQISFLPLSTTFRLDYGTVPIAWYIILELFPQRGILFWNCSHSVVYYFGTVPTAWYFILELFPQRGIFLFHFIMCNTWFAWLMRKKSIGWFGWLTVFNVTFTNISLISLRSVLLVEETGSPKYPEKTTDLLQVTDKLENSQYFWRIEMDNQYLPWLQYFSGYQIRPTDSLGRHMVLVDHPTKLLSNLHFLWRSKSI